MKLPVRIEIGTVMKAFMAITPLLSSVNDVIYRLIYTRKKLPFFFFRKSQIVGKKFTLVCFKYQQI